MTILETKIIFTGRIFTLKQEKVRLPNDVVDELDIIHHPGGAAIVALNKNLDVCLLRQYRHAMKDWVWEIPAGILEATDDNPCDRAKAELQEESGYSAKHWQALGWIQSSPGVFTEKVFLYLATDLQLAEQQLEHGEVLEVHWLPLADAIQQVHDGVINDAKTCVGLFRAAKFLNVS